MWIGQVSFILESSTAWGVFPEWNFERPPPQTYHSLIFIGFWCYSELFYRLSAVSNAIFALMRLHFSALPYNWNKGSPFRYTTVGDACTLPHQALLHCGCLLPQPSSWFIRKEVNGHPPYATHRELLMIWPSGTHTFSYIKVSFATRSNHAMPIILYPAYFARHGCHRET